MPRKWIRKRRPDSLSKLALRERARRQRLFFLGFCCAFFSLSLFRSFLVSGFFIQPESFEARQLFGFILAQFFLLLEKLFVLFLGRSEVGLGF